MTRTALFPMYACIIFVGVLVVGRANIASGRAEADWLGIAPTAALDTPTTFTALPPNPLEQTVEPATRGPQDDHSPADNLYSAYLPLVKIPYSAYLPLVQVPNPFSSPHPVDGAVDQSANVWLSWDFSTDYGAALPKGFSVYVAPIDMPLTDAAVSQLPNPFWDPYTFDSGTAYHWRVVAEDVEGRFIESPTWFFETEAAIEQPDLDAMVAIPEDFFWMGCDRTQPRFHYCFSPKEFPLRHVWIDAFEIDKYEVTNREYLDCVNAGACARPAQVNSNHRKKYFGNSTYDEFPVLYVSHWDAEAFCGWEGKRLPTEAEWEKAARGPIDTREWPWGAEYPDCTRINFTDNHFEDTTCLDDTDRVGMRPQGASPYGVMDMSGNVFEWVHDKYNVFYYRDAPNENPQGPDVSHTDHNRDPDKLPYFTIRGGSYRANWFYTRVTHRHWGHKGPKGTSTDDVPYFRNNFVGFRCARSLPE